MVQGFLLPFLIQEILNMYHCMDFMPSDVWFLLPNEIFTERKLNIGFCPVCGKPVAKLKQTDLNSNTHLLKKSGLDADQFCFNLSNQIDYKKSRIISQNSRKKLYGWIYGINKQNTSNGNIKQYASDFYGNKEIVKEMKE